jgi:hypothetical protein
MRYRTLFTVLLVSLLLVNGMAAAQEKKQKGDHLSYSVR